MSGLALWLAVGGLGGIASVTRFVLDAFVASQGNARFPLGTLIVNLSGALVLGVLAGASVAGHAYLLTGTAVIGSYTTFSTWMLESHRLAEDGRAWLAGVNLASSMLVGVGAAALGHLLGGA